MNVAQVNGSSPFFFTCDHASALTPRRLGTLGLNAKDRERHIAWDIGIRAVSERLAKALDAILICQNYSRLVIDCNRPLSAPSSIPEISDQILIPGNANLDQDQRQARVREIFQPYHARITAELDRRQTAGRSTVLISMHSFTPVFAGFVRPWHAAVMYHRDARLGRILLKLLSTERDPVVGDNQPYAVSDETDYTIPVHGEQRGLPHVALEIRQDLIANEKEQQRWADILRRLLPLAYQDVQGAP